MHPELNGKFDLKCSKCGSDDIKIKDPENVVVSYDEDENSTESPLYNELISNDVFIQCSKCGNHVSMKFD